MSRILSRRLITFYIASVTPKAAQFHSTRAASKMSVGKYEYLVQIPDLPNALDKRLAIRPKHLADLKPHIASGKVVFGGATLSKQPAEGETPDMTGSAMLIKADSEEELRQWLENDEYAKGGAWDLKNMTVTSFKCAVRTAM